MEWVESIQNSFFIESHNDKKILEKYIELVNWAVVQSQLYNEKAIQTFCDSKKADAFLVATAATLGHTIVTYERPSKQSPKDPQKQGRIMIPDVCKDFNVKYCNPIQALRDLGIRF